MRAGGETPVACKTRAPSTAPPGLKEFAEVFADECSDIGLREGRNRKRPVPTPTVANELTAVALSGGGIRSAAFCLGVLQALNRAGIIRQVDYLSTVSGGGYIGTATVIGMSRNQGWFPFERGGDDTGETLETHHLRDNSRYLLQGGALGVASAIAVYLRGLVTNTLILGPFLLAAAAVFVALNPSTAELAQASWIEGGVHGVPSLAGIPFTLISAALGTGLLAIYAVGVSATRLLGLRVRYAIAKFAGLILALLAAVGVIEFHVMALRYIFQRTTVGLIAEVGTGGQAVGQVLAMAVSEGAKLIAVLAPLVALLLPFLRSIAAQAVRSASAGASTFAKTLASRAALVLVAAFLPAMLWLLIMQLAFWGTAVPRCDGASQLHEPCTTPLGMGWPHAPNILDTLFTFTGNGYAPHSAAAVYGSAAIAIVLVFWPLLDVNANSLHQLYRDRLGKAFLVRREEDRIEPDDDFCFTDIDPRYAPCHLINAALNVPGSAWANGRGRNAEFFIFSRRSLGSEATRYVETKYAQAVIDRFNVGTAMAISGAAVAPNMGMASMRPLSPTIAFLNVRLGRWLRHPYDIATRAAAQTDKESRSWFEEFRTWWWRAPGPWRLLREAFFKSGTDIPRHLETEGRRDAGFLFLTDGGHIENLGIYELLKRRCRIIIAVDGEADPALDFSSLNQIERFARIDLGTRIVMDPRPIGARTRLTSEEVRARDLAQANGPHVALGLIDYPPVGKGKDRERGVLVYIKASLSGDEPNYVLAYKAKQPSFPHETTMDQLFTEEQFEAYRALGEHAARHFLEGQDAAVAPFSVADDLVAMLKKAFPDIEPRADACR